MRKNIFFLFFFLIIFSYSYAEKIKYISTNYFDIVYASSSYESAASIARQCDAIYEEICSDYGTIPHIRIPVYINPDTDIYNGYFGNFSQNHIVLYDTPPEENMAVFSDPIISTFTHELTHAVSNTMQNDFWRITDFIFGDIINPGYYFNIPTLISEGATVSQESKKGEGRLNNGYFLHMSRQSKLEGKFPDYKKLTGARDIFPSGSASYGFGGPFAEYIQNKYGMEKYSDFWSYAVNSKDYQSAFKKNYRKSLKAEWECFKNSVFVPEITVIGEKDLTGHPSRITQPLLHNNTVYYLDKPSSSVITAELKDSKLLKQKKLITKKGINSIRLNSSGTVLTIEYINFNHPEEKRSILNYDIGTGKIKKINGTGLRNAVTAEFNEKNFTVAIKTSSQICSLIFINEKDEIEKSIEFNRNEIPFSPVQKDNYIYFILHKNNCCYLCRYDFYSDSPEYQYTDMGTKDVRYLNSFSNGLIFSWAEKNTFPRAGFAFPEENSINIDFSREDVSGGIWNVCTDGSRILYSSKSFDEENLKIADISSMTFISVSLPLNTNTKIHSENVNSGKPVSEKDYKKIFNPRLVFIPLSNATASKVTEEFYLDSNDGLISDGTMLLGATFSLSNLQDSFRWIGSGGYDIEGQRAAFYSLFSGGTKTALLNYSDKISASFDSLGFANAMNEFSISSSIHFGNISSLTFSEANTFFTGRMTKNIYRFENSSKDHSYFFDDTNYLYDKNSISAVYSNIHKTGFNYYEYFGFSAGLAYKTVYIHEKDTWLFPTKLIELGYDKELYHTISPSASFQIPKIIPVEVKDITFNLPISAGISLYPIYNTFLDIYSKTVLFSAEIQNPLGTHILYFHRITLNGIYQGKFQKYTATLQDLNPLEDFKNIDTMYFADYAGLRIDLTGTWNSGKLADSVQLNTMITWLYYLNGDDKGKQTLNLGFSLNI